jgi:thiol:disulfide interchange protein DsbA
MMLSRIYLCFTIVAVSLLAPFTVVAQDSAEPEFIEGQHYIRLPDEVPTRDKNKIEVVEAFWYGCSHCYNFEPMVLAWQKNQPDYVDFWQTPAMWNANMRLHAQMFYAQKALADSQELHEKIFAAMNVQHQRLRDEAAIKKLFVRNGIDGDAFDKAFSSFGVQNQVVQADARARGYRISGTPEVVVNGKFRVSARTAGSQANMLKVIDFLVAKEWAVSNANKVDAAVELKADAKLGVNGL